MRLSRWLIGLAATLIAGLLAAVWWLPPALDWDRYRAEIAMLASDALGQTVRIDGPISLRLLPQPVLTAGQVTMAQGGHGITLTAQEIRLRVGLRPLLSGRLDPRDLVLHGVDARLPWPLGRAALALRAPEWLSSLSARIEDGKLAIGETVFTDVQAALSTREDTGTWAATGTARQSGRPWHFTARLSRPGADGSATIDLTLDSQGPGSGTGAALTGQVAADGTVSGRASGRGADLSEFLPAPAVPFRAEGRFVMAGGLAFADELAGEIGGSPVSGAVSLRLEPEPRLDVALTASRLDLGAWLPPLLKGGGLVGKLPIGVDISAEAAQLAGGTLRRLRGEIEFAGQSVRVRGAQAVLPGDASIRLDGQMLPANGAARSAVFDGTVALAAPALRTTLAWAETAGIGRTTALPAQVLGSAQLTAHVVGGGQLVALDRIAGTLDGAAIGGVMSLRPGTVPALRGALTLDRLDLTPWLASLQLTAGPAAWAKALGGVEADLRLDAEQAVLNGAPLGAFGLDAALEANRLTLRRLAFQPGGVDILVSGVLGEGGRIGDAKLDLKTSDGTRLAGLLPDLPVLVGLRTSPLWNGAASLSLQAAGPPETLAVKLSGELGDLRVEAQPVLDLAGRKLAGPVTLRHPGTPRLLDMLGYAGVGAWLGEGSLGLVAKITADPQMLNADSFDLSAGWLHATGALSLSRGEVPTLSGRVMADTVPVALPDLHGSEPMALGFLSGWRGQVRLEAGKLLGPGGTVVEKARASASLADNVLRLDDIAAQAAGGQITGALKLDRSAELPLFALNLAIAGATLSAPLLDLPFELASGRADANFDLTATGFAPAALLASLQGRIDLHATQGGLAGLDLARAGADLAEADMRTALSGGTMAFDRLDGTAKVAGGIVTIEQAGLAAPSGQIGFAGTFDLPRAGLDLRLTIRPAVTDPPELGLRLSGKLIAPERVPELSALIPWRAAKGL